MNEDIIKLTVNNGRAFVWSGKDWLKLREEHRIVGELVGCLAHLPRQETFPGLPVVLLPEETTLLLERKVARLVQYPSLGCSPKSEIKQRYKKYREQIQHEQIEYVVEDRKRQVTDMIDQIIEGKRLKSLGLKPSKKKKLEQPIAQNPQNDIDREALLQEELDKIKPLPENSTLVQTFTAHPWLTDADEVEVVWDFPTSLAEHLRYKTFKDLWEKGYYISPGHKFGVDFLIYPGDPVKFHAYFLVVCIGSDVQLSGTDLVAMGRLGTSVRKTVVLASFSSKTETLVYQSLTWNGNS